VPVEELVEASGKLGVLDRILTRLKEGGHRVVGPRGMTLRCLRRLTECLCCVLLGGVTCRPLTHSLALSRAADVLKPQKPKARDPEP
jgi:hypothetical protein